MHLTSSRTFSFLRAPALMGLSLLLAASCVDRAGLGDDPDGETGSAGTTGTGTGTAGTGVNGTAGTKGTPTGVAGVSGTGKAGTTGNTGAAGTTGTAGTTGKAGTGGTMCGPVCTIYCQFGNVLDANGCPTCKCNPSPVCKPEECGPLAAGDTAPGAAYPAPMCDGKLVPPTCARDAATGKCAWTRSGCQPCVCGELPPADYSMKCADGTILKPVCEWSAGGTCGWTLPKCPPPPVACPTIACLRACPYGARIDPATGCSTCQCIEPKACGAISDWKSCTADMRCTWLQPGCGTPALSTAGCFAREDVGCQGSCSNGRACLTRVIDPCYNPGGGASCDACGQTQTVCL